MVREHLPGPDRGRRLRGPVAQELERLGPTADERLGRAAFLERVDAEYGRVELLEIEATGSLDEVALAIQKRVEELFS